MQWNWFFKICYSCTARVLLVLLVWQSSWFGVGAGGTARRCFFKLLFCAGSSVRFFFSSACATPLPPALASRGFSFSKKFCVHVDKSVRVESRSPFSASARAH